MQSQAEAAQNVVKNVKPLTYKPNNARFHSCVPQMVKLAARTASEGSYCQRHNNAPPIFEQRIMFYFLWSA